jgi:Ulp1 family protease
MLLPPTAWLNDNVIIGSFQHIAAYVNDKAGANPKANPKCAALNSYFYERLLSQGLASCGRLSKNAGIKKANFFDIETILIPICQQSHWTVAVVRPQQKTISHIDSILSGRGHAKVKNTVLGWVKATLEEKFIAADWKIIDFNAPRQDNGYDCGVFAITNGICFALGVNPMDAYSANQLTLQRKRLAAILLNGGFSGEFSLDGI